MDRIFQKITCNLSGKVRRRKYKGRMHVIVPAVMIPEGVLNGNEGPGLYLAEELHKTPIAWNNKPAVFNHPEEGTANDAGVMEETELGTVFNTAGKNKKLSCEVWLDEEKTNDADVSIIQNIEAGLKVEVSTGVYLNKEVKSGTYKKTGKKYEWIARDIQPDHLAIFSPASGEVGAASIEDGAGLGQVNNRAKDKIKDNIKPSLNKSLSEAVKRLGGDYVNNEMTFSEIQCQLCELLAEKFGDPGKYWQGWVVDVYSTSVIYRDQDGDLYQIGYSKSDKGVVSLTGDAVEVERSVQYVTANGEALIPVNNTLTPKEKVMAKKTSDFDKKSHIEKITANGKFDPTFIETLNALPDETLQKITVINAAGDPGDVDDDDDEIETPIVKNKKGKVVANAAAVVTETKTKVFNEEDLPPAILRIVNREKREKAELIKKLVANESCKMNEKFLEKLDFDDLKNLHETLKVKNKGSDGEDEEDEDGTDIQSLFLDGVNYSGASGAPPTQNRRSATEEEGLEFGEIDFKAVSNERAKDLAAAR